MIVDISYAAVKGIGVLQAGVVPVGLRVSRVYWADPMVGTFNVADRGNVKWGFR